MKGDEIKAHFEDKEVGNYDAWPGTLDGVNFHLACMKEPDYVMSLMTTYGSTEHMGTATRRNYKDDNVNVPVKIFKYPEVIHNHFKGRHAVDDHNAKRHSPISLEVVWASQWWPNRVFAFCWQ